jgi:TonB family protein
MTPEPELHLLIEVDEEAARLRRRVAAFASITIHLLIVILILLEPTLFRSVAESMGLSEARRTTEPLTYLALPPDDQVLKEKQKTGIPSDKDRLAQQGIAPIPGPKLPPPPVMEPGGQAEKPLAEALPPPALKIEPPGTPEGIGKLPLPQPGIAESPLKDLRPLEVPRLSLPPSGAAGSTVQDAMREVAKNRQGPAVGDVGGGPQSQSGRVGQAQILSDTMGVNFDPYLQRLVAAIRANWYAVMPEIAHMGKRGRVVVVFDVSRDGMVSRLMLISTSGSEPLDRAALAGISASVPFQALPPEFRGPSVRLQVTFLYNMPPQ